MFGWIKELWHVAIENFATLIEAAKLGILILTLRLGPGAVQRATRVFGMLDGRGMHAFKHKNPVKSPSLIPRSGEYHENFRAQAQNSAEKPAATKATGL